uniref:Uncharacterized protein n=1 Tax=Arundo donax TaxID=35708 RepID=A0A0A9EI83_ARUDO
MVCAHGLGLVEDRLRELLLLLLHRFDELRSYRNGAQRDAEGGG